MGMTCFCTLPSLRFKRYGTLYICHCGIGYYVDYKYRRSPRKVKIWKRWDSYRDEFAL